ncbi:MAG: hypothetical protein ACKVOJ_12550 [Sphingomonadaceae bacterium]
MASRILLAALTGCLVSQPALAQFGTGCVTRAEAEDMATFVLPSLVKAIARQCASSLPPTAALSQSATLIAARYQPQSELAWGSAARAIDKMMGLPVADSLGAERATALLAPILTRELGKAIKPADCDPANRLIDALQPLPARNVASIMMVIVEAGNARKPASLPIKLCPQQVASQ